MSPGRRWFAGPNRRWATVGFTLLAGLVMLAAAGPLLSWRAGPPGTPFAPPSAAHLLGTDDVGRDLLADLAAGAAVSLPVGLLAALVATTVGTAVGLLAGYRRGWVDSVAMRGVDVALSLPELPLAIVLGVFLGGGVGTQVLVIALVTWAPGARELRARVLEMRERDHVQAVRAMGAGSGHVLVRHLLPGVGTLVAPQFVLATKTAILLEATLAFLGLGGAAQRSWGTTLSFAQARSAFLSDAWLWWVVPPGLCIAAAVLGFALIGHAIEDRGRPASGPAVVSPAAPIHAAHPHDVVTVDALVVDHGPGTSVAVDGVTLRVAPGEAVAVVGESGSGKTTLVHAVAAMLRPPARVRAGTVAAGRIGLVPQDAIEALDPVQRVGPQVAEAIADRRARGRAATAGRVRELLTAVGLDPAITRRYPHELSGGMRQRVVIATALAREPEVLLADEPTSGLDVLGQLAVLDLLAGLRERLGLALVLVSHDLDVALGAADRVLVMRHGALVEQGWCDTVGAAPTHPYTRELLAAIPRLEPLT